MFLASDREIRRAAKVRRHLKAEPGLALLLGAVNFEWTVCRAVLFLSSTPNSKLRARIRAVRSFDGYKELWKSEVLILPNHRSLAEIVHNWHAIKKAFEKRNALVHGQDRCTRNMAMPHIEALLKGVGYIESYCESVGKPLYQRMPVRRK